MFIKQRLPLLETQKQDLHFFLFYDIVVLNVKNAPCWSPLYDAIYRQLLYFDYKFERGCIMQYDLTGPGFRLAQEGIKRCLTACCGLSHNDKSWPQCIGGLGRQQTAYAQEQIRAGPTELLKIDRKGR